MKIKVLVFTELNECAEFVSQFLQFEQTLIPDLNVSYFTSQVPSTETPYPEDIRLFSCGIFEFYCVSVSVFLDKYTFSDLEKIFCEFFIHIKKNETDIETSSLYSILSVSVPENSRHQITTLPLQQKDYLQIKHKIFHRVDDSTMVIGGSRRGCTDSFMQTLFAKKETQKSQTIAMLVENIQKNIVFQNFQYIASFPNEHPVLSGVQKPYLEDFASNLMHFLESGCVHKFGMLWALKNYGRYVHKTLRSSCWAPSYLFFRKEIEEPGFVFCLLKSNTHINHAHIDHWFSGSVKQVKIRALLFKFKICDSVFCSTIDPQEISIVPVVTFTRPSPDFLPLSDMINADSAQARLLLKTNAMHAILNKDRFKNDFSDWEILHFEDVRHRASRLIAFQQYRGFSLFGHQRFFACAPIFRFKAIFTLLDHFNEIVSTQRLWPRDIKVENVCALETQPNVYKLSFIDFKSPTMLTNTFLKDERIGHVRSLNYFHPIQHIARYTVHDLRAITCMIDRRPAPTESGYPRQGWAKSERFKLVAIHVCFELAFLIFQILHSDRFTAQSFDEFIKILNGANPFPKVNEFERELLKRIRLDIQPSQTIFQRLYDLPMYRTLKIFIYEQQFLTNPNTSVSNIFELFFCLLRTEFLNYLKTIEKTVGEVDRPIFLELEQSLLSTEKNYRTLSASWTVRLAKMFENIPTTPKPADNVIINQLVMV